MTRRLIAQMSSWLPRQRPRKGLCQLARSFKGWKTFNDRVTIIDNTGSPNVPLVVQYTGAGAGHIQDWWSGGGTPLAYIDTQPILRLGWPRLR